ncbi:hypothetical protein G3N56_07400 [Desulfovibrio sulfodismutans]|uniref:Uncharacterized protein n=1 Tax=Desulfolutivibrio sulfodismutans TaxID=63561 RepID=A0A7K3NKC2_9BACT|nr:hypothetical protein [Desulfolutivibrio sulfodismutans]NDY56567.1 hypothetical protein [Desulfolutivibrio sulfodismutans]QLA13102.1 hypothetical protein GD606_12910 [Desulfolutivibrio sulfodismutans DSM 3696]
MNHTIRILLGTLLVVFLASPLCAEGMLPDRFQGEVAVYPGAVIVKVLDFPKSVMVRLKSQDTPERIAAFYKTDMAAKGWTTQVADATATGAFLVMTKETRRLIVEVERGPDATSLFNISL